jgi:hypothetical protein
MTTTINADNGVSSGSAGLKSSADNSGVLQLQTNGTAAVTVDTSQRVLVGLTSALTISGASTWQQQIAGTGATGSVVARFSDNANPARFFTVKSRGTSIGTNTIVQNGDELGSLDFAAADGTSYTTAARISAFVDGTPGTGDLPSRLTFNTASDGSVTLTERMRIDSSGSVLMGLTSSTIGGDGGKLLIDNGSGLGLLANRTGDGNIVRWYRTNTQVGSINLTSGATAYVTSSDYRLKQDIAPMTGALAKVAALKPVTYKWKEDGSDGQGFIAHELAEVVPQCVSGDKDAVKEDGSIDPQGIDTSFLVATLTAAIQEQQALITAQASAITQLQADVAALKGASV